MNDEPRYEWRGMELWLVGKATEMKIGHLEDVQFCPALYSLSPENTSAIHAKQQELLRGKQI